MPRLKPAPKSPLFEALDNEELAKMEARDCAVIAVAAAAGVSYATAHEALRLAGRKAKAGTPMWITETALKALGFKLTVWSFQRRRDKAASYGPGFVGAHITTHQPKRFHKHWVNEGTLLFRTAGHILCVKDGVNHDWSHRNSLRVWEIYQVEPDDGQPSPSATVKFINAHTGEEVQ